MRHCLDPLTRLHQLMGGSRRRWRSALFPKGVRGVILSFHFCVLTFDFSRALPAISHLGMEEEFLAFGKI